MEPILEKVIQLITNEFKPANHISEATDFLDTKEIHEAIKRLAPETEITAQQVFEALSGAGFNFSHEPGKMNFNLKWMLIRQ